MTSAMTTRLVPARFLFWTPRLGGLAMAAFLAVFALDALNRPSFAQILPAAAIHLLPSLLVLAIVVVGWRFEWAGAIGFIALAVVYAAMVWGRIDWIAAISLPLLVAGLLFRVSGRARIVSPRE
jgi:hypothetical protein